MKKITKDNLIKEMGVVIVNLELRIARLEQAERERLMLLKKIEKSFSKLMRESDRCL